MFVESIFENTILRLLHFSSFFNLTQRLYRISWHIRRTVWWT